MIGDQTDTHMLDDGLKIPGMLFFLGSCFAKGIQDIVERKTQGGERFPLFAVSERLREVAEFYGLEEAGQFTVCFFNKVNQGITLIDNGRSDNDKGGIEVRFEEQNEEQTDCRG